MNPVFIRRSIRQFTPADVSKDQLDILLKAGLYAPSARNTQPWYFLVVTERSQLDKIPDFHPYASMIRTAPLAILVCGDLLQEKNIGYIVQTGSVRNISFHACWNAQVKYTE